MEGKAKLRVIGDSLTENYSPEMEIKALRLLVKMAEQPNVWMSKHKWCVLVGLANHSEMMRVLNAATYLTGHIAESDEGKIAWVA